MTKSKAGKRAPPSDEGVGAETVCEDGAKLTIKQERFAQAYVETGIGSEAYRRVYDTSNMLDKTVWEQASRLLARSKVNARVEKLKADALARHQITVDRIMSEYSNVGFANMEDYLTVQDDGTAYVDLSGLTREQMAAINEVIVDEYTEGRGDDARNVKRVKLKIGDKKGSLDSLSRIMGLFVDKHEVTGKGGEPLAPVTNTRDLARAVLDILRTAQLASQPGQENEPEAKNGVARPALPPIEAPKPERRHYDAGTGQLE
jgi:phage terminase small subunit